MKYRILYTLFFCAGIFLSCSVVLGQVHKVNMYLNVAPDSSIVYVNGEAVGATPLNLNLKADFNDYLRYKLRVSRRGYKDSVIFIDESNISNLPKRMDFSLSKIVKKINTEEQKLILQFEKLLIEFSNGQQIGETRFGTRVTPIYWEQSGVSGGTVEFNNIADKELKDYGYKVFTASKLFSDDQNAEPKLILGGTLASIKYDASVRNFETKGSCNMTIEWQLYSRIKGKVIFKYSTNGFFSKVGSNSETIIKESFRDAMDNLLGTDTFAKVVLSQEVFSGDLSTKNEKVVAIKKINKSTYSSRAEMIQELIKSCVTVKCDDGFGSGFFISADGLIITNSHVIHKSGSISVVLENGIDIPAELIYENEENDLALIKIKGKGFKPVVFGNSDGAKVGIELIAIGTPRLEELGQTVTKGILSGKRIFDGRAFLQTDATINGGNSGGPLFNEAGEVIGINTYKIRGAEGLNLSIPINVAIDRLNIKFE